MNYTFKLENLDCANCAAKAEAAVAKVSGVRSCSVNFFAQKMNLETDTEMTSDFMKIIHKAMKKIEPDIILKSV